MGLRPHYLPAVIFWLVSTVALLWIRRRLLARSSHQHHNLISSAAAIIFLWNTAALVLSPVRVAVQFPEWPVTWVKGIALLLAVYTIYFAVVEFILPGRFIHDPGRRRLLRAGRAAAIAAPAAVLPFTILYRNNLRLHEIEIPLPGLARDLDGLRLVQLSDIHMSAFLSEDELSRAIDMANETRAHLALVTGDLISVRRDPLDKCLRQLKRLRAEAGILGCHGNHEIYARSEAYTTEAGRRMGMDFLRSESRVLRFGTAEMNFAGVDYQPRSKPYLAGAQTLKQPGMLNVLLSHNPDVFPVAARQGYDLTISGHTHGGQVNFEILDRSINVARFFTPYIYGLYREGAAQVFVTRGIGTVGVPVRFGAPPEIALIRLRGGESVS